MERKIAEKYFYIYKYLKKKTCIQCFFNFVKQFNTLKFNQISKCFALLISLNPQTQTNNLDKLKSVSIIRK